MLRKFFLNRKSKPRNFYILAAVSTPVAIAAAVSAWAVGNPIATFVLLFIGYAQIVWSVCILVMAWNLSRLEKNKIHRVPQRTPLRRGVVIFYNILWLLLLALCVIMLAIVLVLAHGRPLYLILMYVWLIILTGGHFFFAPLDDYIFNKRSLWWWRF